MSTTTKTRKPLPRWVKITLALLLLAAGGWGGFLWWRGPVLRPAAARVVPQGYYLLYSAQGQGYPAVQTGIGRPVRTPEGREVLYQQEAWLDDLCRPAGAVNIHGIWNGPGIVYSGYDACFPQVSPLRTRVAWRNGFDRGKAMIATSGRQGETTDATFPDWYTPSAITEGGLLLDHNGGVRQPDGTRLSLPKGWRPAPRIGSNDARYLPIYRKNEITIYDLQEGRILFPEITPLVYTHTVTGNLAFTGGMLFRDGARFLLVFDWGQPVYSDGGKLVKALGKVPTPWQWGEDGSAWTIDGMTLQVLQWRTGTPRLETVPVPALKGAPRGNASVVVWGDGLLVAAAVQRRNLPQRLVEVAQWLRSVIGTKPQVTEGVYHLTLYRDGRRVGTYVVPYIPCNSTVGYVNHLAFTGDGRHLAWVITEDPIRVWVRAFVVPR